MKHFVTPLFAIASLCTASAALAGPPARVSMSEPCGHCKHTSESSLRMAQHRGGLFSTQRACKHGLVAEQVRWGRAQKPCEHCKHTG